jgi:hypothetical protein
MTQRERRTIGLDRPIQIEWLDAVAGRLAAGASAKEARAFAWHLLDGVIAGKTAQSARGKTLTVLSRVWLTVPVAAEALRNSAVPLVGRASGNERLAIHWAMMSAAYPFFVDIAGNVGKLVGLNGEFSLSQLTRRLIEVWGDRSTLRPATQRTVRSMVQWGVLRDAKKPGRYLPLQKRIVVSAGLAELLVEGVLIASKAGMALDQLLTHPAIFPFEIRVDAARLRRNSRLRVHRQGDQSDFVEFEESRPAPPASDRKPAKRKKVGRPIEASGQLDLASPHIWPVGDGQG